MSTATLERQVHEALEAALSDSPYTDPCEGFLQWCKDECYILDAATNTYVPFQWYPADREAWARALAVDAHGDYVHTEIGFCMPRGYGKTAVCGMYDVYRCLHFEHQHVVIGANDEEQGDQAVYKDHIKKLILNSPKLAARYRAGEITLNDLEALFHKTQSRIEVITSAPDTKVGRRVTVFHRTESCMEKDDELSSAIVAGMGARRNVLEIKDSTIGEAGNSVNDLKARAERGDDGVFFHYVCHADLEAALRDAPPHVSRPYIRRMARRLSDRDFKRWILNVPGGSAGRPWEMLLGGASRPELRHPVPLGEVGAFFMHGNYVRAGGLDKARALSERQSRTIWTVVAYGIAADAPRLVAEAEAAGERDVEPPLAVLVLESVEIPKGLRHEHHCKQAIQRSVDRYGALDVIGMEQFEAESLHQWAILKGWNAKLINPSANVQHVMFRAVDEPIRAGTFRYSAACELLDQELKHFPVREVNKRQVYGQEKPITVVVGEGAAQRQLLIKDDTVYAIANALFASQDFVQVVGCGGWTSTRVR